MIHVDTHVLVWLWEKKAKYKSVIARRIEHDDVACSPAVLLELQFLKEIGRITEPPEDMVSGLAQRIGLMMSETPFADIVSRSLSLSWTRDPFDRLIVAHAAADGARLLTRDENIHRNFRGAVWD